MNQPEREPDFQTEVYGKWILAGEHAVLRGSPALVFPFRKKSFRLSYWRTPAPLTVHTSAEMGEEWTDLFQSVLNRGSELVGRSETSSAGASHSPQLMTGEFHIENSIAIGAGLGASAALCVALARWFQNENFVAPNDLYDFARTLEDLFHGESSGVDIAVAMSGKGLYFVRGGERRVIEPVWKPRWYLSFTGERGLTAECIAKVKELWKREPESGANLDAQMGAAVEMAEQALLSNGEERFERLCDAIQAAGSCFQKWGLTEGAVGTHLEMLRAHGAAAVKPTGSGGGGYALSLWKTEPPQSVREVLIPLN